MIQRCNIKKKHNQSTVWWKRVTQTVHRHPGKVSHMHRRTLQPTQNLQMHTQALTVAFRKAWTQHITGKSKVTKESRQSHSDRTLTHAWTERTNIPTAVRDTACMKTHTHFKMLTFILSLLLWLSVSLSLCFPSLFFSLYCFLSFTDSSAGLNEMLHNQDCRLQDWDWSYRPTKHVHA